MGVLKLLLLFFFFLSPVIYATNHCPQTSMCANSSFSIRFPFQLKGQESQNCSYPGFDLSCSSQGVTVLNLPYSGEFLVRDINYQAQEIQLYDPYNCLPRRLLDINLSGCPFSPSYYQNYTFLSCPSELTRSRFTSIDCLSNSTNTTLATSSLTLVTSMTKCKIMAALPIPVSRPLQYQDGFSSNLSDDLQLTWNVPYCQDCEAQGGMCGLENDTSLEITCFYSSRTGRTNSLRVFSIIALVIVLPSITCAFGIAFFMCCMDDRNLRSPATNTTLTIAAVTPQSTNLSTGLDESTIESYTKVVLGESRRLPWPNDNTCPICLSDYSPKETVRCIPECKHCFHAHCIDEWLRMTGTCPVCRNSPSPPAHHHV
ncbi:putative RING-H2 finger protein ATL21A [Cornus florida]|uniref:putative RING-H2 finger protein ATL21A n=1 Tax=Cornus florida TaxID=4283 RepID=UPI00289A239F|nr:putative RING-H2 finger protein ATL21A [Cornus florida]